MKIRWLKSGYGKLKRKIFFQILLMVPGTWILFVVVYDALHGRLANSIVGLIQKQFFLEYQDALNIYQHYIRNNMDKIVYLFIAFSFFLFFYLSLSWFVKYFIQIDKGLDALLNGQEIVLSPEMETMEKKMNQVRQDLEKRETEAKLAKKRKDDLVMYLAHDIRTPLTSVIGYLSLLDEAPKMPEEQREKYIHITLEKSCRLEALVNEFFEITRYDLHQTDIEKTTIDLSYMMMQMVEEFYPILSKNQNTVELQIPEDLSICADPIKLARVFQNILKNAAAYSDQGTNIVIRAAKEENYVRISFENHGKTIPRQKLLSIFDKFCRLDDARTTKSGGSGLGLAIAKEIVQLHDGRIWAESEEGKTVFTVELPNLIDV